MHNLTMSLTSVVPTAYKYDISTFLAPSVNIITNTTVTVDPTDNSTTGTVRCTQVEDSDGNIVSSKLILVR